MSVQKLINVRLLVGGHIGASEIEGIDLLVLPFQESSCGIAFLLGEFGDFSKPIIVPRCERNSLCYYKSAGFLRNAADVLF